MCCFEDIPMRFWWSVPKIYQTAILLPNLDKHFIFCFPKYYPKNTWRVCSTLATHQTVHLLVWKSDCCGFCDADDEDEDLHPACGESFHCENSGSCINQSKVCNFHTDCPLGEDEGFICGEILVFLNKSPDGWSEQDLTWQKLGMINVIFFCFSLCDSYWRHNSTYKSRVHFFYFGKLWNVCISFTTLECTVNR